MGLYRIILRPVRGTLSHGHVRPGTGLIVLGLFVLLLGLDGGGGAQHEDVSTSHEAKERTSASA